MPYGRPFPAGAASVVASPVVVKVNGNSAQFRPFTRGYPGSIDGYQVNFQVPAATTAGTARLSLLFGFINGTQVTSYRARSQLQGKLLKMSADLS